MNGLAQMLLNLFSLTNLQLGIHNLLGAYQTNFSHLKKICALAFIDSSM